MKIVLSIFLLLLMITSCVNESETSKMTIYYQTVYDSLIYQLKKENIWYKVIDEKTLKVKKTEFNKISEISITIANEQIKDANKSLFSSISKSQCELDSDCIEVRICGGCCSSTFIHKSNQTQFLETKALICVDVPDLCATKSFSCNIREPICINSQCVRSNVNQKTGMPYGILETDNALKK